VALLALAVLGGLAVGAIRGVRLRQLHSLRLRAVPLVVAALGAQLALGLGSSPPPAVLRDVLVVASYACVGLWIARNARYQPGGLGTAFAVLGLGWLLNVVPMVLNGGMPVSSVALGAIGARDEVVDDGHLWKHVPATAETKAAWLGDVVPVPLAGAVISAGDVALLMGAGAAVAAALRGAA
jgi:Family of unknown function (DUF5317)